MKRLFFIIMATFAISLSANAQVKIETPHPDLGVKISRCAYANGTVVIDMVITNFGQDEMVQFYTSSTVAYLTAYDDEGNMYTPQNSKMQLGIISQGLKGFSEFVLPSEVPLKFRVELQNISTKATKLSLIKMPIESNGAMALKMQKPLVIKNLEWVK